jgi:N-acetylmuramoyl-L-alanine amidase
MKFTAPKRQIKRVFIHCSASDNPAHDDVSIIKQWHLAKTPPWKDVGYHFYIKKDGTIQTGRNIEVTPAAQAGHNTGTIAICCGGLKDFPARQMNSLVELCDAINEAIAGVTFHGHCEVDSGKTCPVFAYKEILDLDSNGRMTP